MPNSSPQRLPLPPTSTRTGDWPALAPTPEGVSSVLLLWGLPGSLVERVAQTFDLAGMPLRADRFGPRPPTDLFQRYDTITSLDAGSADAQALIAQWREQLPARGIPNGVIFDWLLLWDNAMLRALRPHLPEAVLMAVIRDPRDMLLDWLAFGASAPFALESPVVAARWLAQSLEQVADLQEQDLFPHRVAQARRHRIHRARHRPGHRRCAADHHRSRAAGSARAPAFRGWPLARLHAGRWPRRSRCWLRWRSDWDIPAA